MNRNVQDAWARWKIGQLAGRVQGFTSDTVDGHGYDSESLTVDGAQSFALSFLPVEFSEHVYLRGLEQQRTVDWSRSGQTLSILAAMDARAGDLFEVYYEYSAGAPVEQLLMTYAGTVNNDQHGGVPFPSEAFGMTGQTAGRRIAGVWTTTAIDGLLDEGVADAYSAESTVTAVPADHPVYFNWCACTGPDIDTVSGVFLQTDNVTITLYLWRQGAVVLSSPLGPAPVVGDDIKIVTDFLTRTATAYKNGTVIATLDFSAESWYVAGGAQ